MRKTKFINGQLWVSAVLPALLLMLIPGLVGCLPSWLPFDQARIQRGIDSNTLPLQPKWEYKINDLLYGPLSSLDNLLYVPQGKIMHAVNIETGGEIWAFTNDSEIRQEFPSPAARENVLVLHTIKDPSSAEINVLNTATGKQSWADPATTVYSFSIDSGQLYMGRAGQVKAYHLGDGTTAWEMSQGLPTHVAINVYSYLGKVYVVTYERVYVLDRVGGQLLQSFEYSRGSFELFSDGILYTSRRAAVIAMNANTGTIVWQAQVKADDDDGVLTLLRDVLYVPTYGGDLVALDKNTGVEKWRTAKMGKPLSNIVVFNNRGYVISRDAMLHAFDPSTGVESGTMVTSPRELARYPSGRLARPSLVAAERVLIATFGDGVIYGFEP